LPVVTIALIVAISVVSLVSYAHPALTEALERRPGALGHWQLWRLVSPLLVQTDGVGALAGVMVLLAVAGLVAEPLLGGALFLGAFLVSGMVGHAVGNAWQPDAGGASVGVLGPVGVLVAILLRSGRAAAATVRDRATAPDPATVPHPATTREPAGRIPLPGRVIGVGGLVLAVWVALIHDIHGPALLAGMGTGALLLVLVPGLTGRQSGADLFNRLAGSARARGPQEPGPQAKAPNR
jgi:membrane associated rhomboid family serine protease